MENAKKKAVNHKEHRDAPDISYVWKGESMFKNTAEAVVAHATATPVVFLNMR